MGPRCAEPLQKPPEGARRNKSSGRFLLAAALFSLLITPANAIIFYSTGDPAHNTTAPGGSLTNSGWQFQGIWGGFLGTPIAPKYFIAAAHVGGSVGTPLVLNGVSYTTTAVFDDPDTDLRLWRICGTFPTFAPLYTNTNEVGKSLIVFGRGTQRAGPVTTTNFLGNIKTNGWLWGPYDGAQRWGTNVVASVVNGDGVLGDAGIGEVLQATFDASGGPNECHLSVGDSSGAVFIQDGPQWKLAAINYAVDGPYNTSDTGAGFDAAIFDAGGLYEKNAAGTWTLTPDLPGNQAGSFYSTRISSRMNWINSVLSAPIPPDSQPVLQSSTTVNGTFADHTNAVVDDTAKTVTLPQPGQSEFYRLRSCSSHRIASIRVQGGNVVLTYE
ncbi:MAG TPA: hypothetical protein VJW76_04670 [Verrucomicrobiae bacterium]|nr:hypothetical protein [Verrucomicrobiae bacterium]